MTKRFNAGMIVAFSLAAVPLAAGADEHKSQTEKMVPLGQGSPPHKVDTIIKAQVPNHPRQVLKNGKHFLVMNDRGGVDIKENIGGGLYRDDTRYLSDWEMTVDGAPLSLLSARCGKGYAGRFVYGNRALSEAHSVPEQTVLIQRDIVITDGMRERLALTNFGPTTAKVTVAIKYGADFADMFEVRGMPRKKRGEILAARIDEKQQTVTLPYRGLDGQLMKTMIGFARMKPASLTAGEATFEFELAPKNVKVIESAVLTCSNEPDPVLFDYDGNGVLKRQYSFVGQLAVADQKYESWIAQGATIKTDNHDFNVLLERGYRDIYMLRQPTPKGECLAAGIPWFTVAFGRDEEIAARELLPVMPDLAKEIIAVLAAYQGTHDDSYTEEHPGRIMHELRLGEMARLKEIPFIPYYGTVDGTPLWIGLVGRYVDWTGDLDFARKYWPNVQSALAYLDARLNKGSYLEYGENKGAALSNQGWKDSADSVMYDDGSLVKPPVALCEVQGYVYDAWVRAAHVADLLGYTEESAKLRKKAEAIRTKFQTDFWSPHMAYIALALDGEGKRCDVVSSNPGHLLATGILTNDQAKSVAERLVKNDMFTGWGVRTLSALEQAYNPLSYHNGSVWPHDNALIVEGLAEADRKQEAASVLTGIFDVAQRTQDTRLPELFCGFSRSYSDKPIWYPVSCSPQAWAAASPFLMLDSLLGLKADAANKKLTVSHPLLPDCLTHVEVTGLRVGAARIDLRFDRSAQGTTCSVINKTGEATVAIEQ